MAHRHTSAVDRRRYRELLDRVEQLSERVDRTQDRAERLENTLKGVLREVGDVSLGCRCSSCDNCYLVIKDGLMNCPQCGFQGSM